jgi:hypothetical protein
MGTEAGRSGPARLVRPRALFAGAACAFIACCLAGRLGSRHNPFDRFERFHANTNGYTHFYPTASQVRALALERLDPGKIAVVVGGNSILNGIGQAESELWTRELQARLGGGYSVLNLGSWGVAAHEFGAVAAEMVAPDRPRLILVGLVTPVAYPCVPDGLVYPGFFWDAYQKGLIHPDPGRMAAIARVPEGRPGSTPLGETPTRALLNSACYFDDLWTAFTYRHACTVWTPHLSAEWYRPRRALPDPGWSAPPFELRYPPEALDRRMAVVRQWFLCGGGRKDGSGRWVADPSAPAWAALQDGARCCFPEPDRKRTLLVVQTQSPYYVGRLSPDERDHYYALSRLTAEKLEGAGFASLDMADRFTAEEFADDIHLSAPGGAKLAALVAGRVRRLAADLGYARPDPVPRAGTGPPTVPEAKEGPR